MTLNSYPRESVEFQPVIVTVSDVVVTTGVTFQVTGNGERPIGTWVAPTVVGGQIGVMVSGYAPGTYIVWAKVVSNPETPVINCGVFIVS